jgi:hypothetical protein
MENKVDTDQFADDEVSYEADGMADAIHTPQGDFNKYVFIIPLAAPLPNELSAFVTEGPLLERLLPLASKEPDDDFAVVAISGAELLNLERCWHSMQEARKVAILTELPGARYDVLFTQAVRQLGLRSVSWPSIEEGVAAREIEQQRTKDKSPWLAAEDEAHRENDNRDLPRRFAKGSSLKDVDRAVEAPPETEELDDDDIS